MRLFLFLLLLSPSFLTAQDLTEPEISEASGFYDSDFEVQISHPDPNATLLYTLDGSEPIIENINGKEWDYKKTYPLFPGDDFGSIYHDTLWTYEYSNALTITDRTSEETVLADVYTGIEKYDIHPEGDLFKGTVLRVRAYSEEEEEYSEIVTRNYFVTPQGEDRYSVPVVALSMNNDEFYDYNEGIGVPGVLFDEWREDNPSAPYDGFAPANYRLKGKETELFIHFNYLEDGQEVLNHGAGLRINGNYSRVAPNKTLRLYARNDYGTKKFKHYFFEDYEVKKFKRLLLRNSGNDVGASVFRDAFMHELSKNLNFDIQESQPVVVFINGEYNGLRNLRERYDKKYFKSIHDVPEESLDFLENHMEVKEGDDEFYNEMTDFFKMHDLSEESDFEEAISYMDPINFTDYYATYIYVANDDWPHNNYLFWRYKTDYNPEGNQGVKDGRFRWLLKDLDWGFHLHHHDENAYDANTLEWATRVIDESNPFEGDSNLPTLLIRRLLENDQYRDYFVTRFADLLNTTFKESRVLEIVDQYEAVYGPEIEENGKRWSNYALNSQDWEEDVDNIKEFALNRPEFQRTHLIEKFDLDKEVDLVVNVSNDAAGYVHLNTIDLLPSTDGIEESTYPWLGVYFKNLPVDLKAIPKEGYVFSHWSGASDSTDPEISLTLTNDTYIKAHFITEDMDVDEENLQEYKLYPNPTAGKVYIASEESLEEVTVFDEQGRRIKIYVEDDNSLDLSGLSSGIYFVQLQNENGIKKVKRVIKK